MSRFIKDQEDVDRLPYGMVRTGYDADTVQYTFLDTTSQTHYVSAPGEAYGTLSPVATAHFQRPSRGPGRKPTLQAYERTVFFADDTNYQRNRSGDKEAPPPTSIHRSSTTVRKHEQGGGGLKRSASFSDLLPAHLITSASQSESQKGSGTTTPAKPRSSNARRGHRRGAAPSPPPTPTRKSPREKEVMHSPSSSDSRSSSPLAYSDDKAPWSPAAADLEALLLPRSLPPVPPPKDNTSPVSPGPEGGSGANGNNGGGVRASRLALRVLGRTLDAVKGAHRPRGGEEQQHPEDGDEWVVV